MESDLIYSLEIVAYEGNLLDSDSFSSAFQSGLDNVEFKDLIRWVTNEINVLGNIDERIGESNDNESFIIELSGFLKELNCPFASFTSGKFDDRLSSIESRYLLLEYLLDELMTFKMLATSKPEDNSNVITINESSTAASLKDITITLQLGKPPDTITVPDLFKRINVTLDQFLEEVGRDRIGEPLFTPSAKLSDASWVKLEKLQKTLDAEYDLRRLMLLTRLDVTIQSFKWSDKLKNKQNDITDKYSIKRKQLDVLQVGGENTDMAAFLGSRNLLAIVEKTSSATVQKNTKSKIQRLIIGSVPDRGGRANEMSAPPPEMPSWQKRQSDRGGRGGSSYQSNRGGNGGGGRGGYQNNNNARNYNQGGSFNQGSSYNQGNSYNQNNSYNQSRNSNYQQPQQSQQKAYQLPQDAYFQSQDAYNHPQAQYHQQNDPNNRQANKRRGGRVQGGWSNRESHESSYSNYNQQQPDANTQGYHQPNFGDNNHRGGKRGRSNYNRGGGGGRY